MNTSVDARNSWVRDAGWVDDAGVSAFGVGCRASSQTGSLGGLSWGGRLGTRDKSRTGCVGLGGD